MLLKINNTPLITKVIFKKQKGVITINISGLLRQNYSINNNMNQLSRQINKSDMKIATGKRINSAADSPSEMLKLSRFEAQRRGEYTAQRNIQSGISMLQVMDDKLGEIGNLTSSIRDLAVEYQSDTNSIDDKKEIEKNIKGLYAEMENIIKDTSFNGFNPFEKGNVNIQTGANKGNNYSINTGLNRLSELRTETIIKEYDKESFDFSARNPFDFRCVSGTVTLRSDKNEGEFEVNVNGETISGELNFSEDGKKAHFDIKGRRGEIILNNNSSKESLSGNNQLVVQGGLFTSSINFRGNGSEKIKETVTNRTSVDISNITALGMEQLVDLDFIDKISDNISSKRTSIGIDTNILESRLRISENNYTRNSESLSRIEDLDMAKELLKKNKNEILLNSSISMFTDNLDRNRQYIYSLL